jgi:Zn-dependent protease
MRFIEYNVYVKLMTVHDVQIGFDFTLLVTSVIMTGYIAVILTPSRYPMLNPLQDWIVAITGAASFFVSLLIHEMSHSIAAMIFGFKIRHIIFSTFGGALSYNRDQSEDRRSEGSHKRRLKVAMAGPAMSFVMSALFGLSWWLQSRVVAVESLPIKEAIQSILYYAAVFNGFLGLVNLVPILPFDGGNILRILLLRSNKKRGITMKISQRIVILISCGLLALATYFLFSGSLLIGVSVILSIWILQSEWQIYRSIAI